MQPRHLDEIATAATLRAVAVTLTLLFGGCPGEGVQLQPDGAAQPDRGPELGGARDAPRAPGDGPAPDGAPPSDGSRPPADGAAAPDGAAPPDAKPKPDTSSPPKCTAGACSGHGVCSVSGGTPSCACDEGFTGPTCAQKRADFWRRTLIRAGLGDPNVHRVHDDLYYLTGTEGSARTITVYRSTDLETFKPLVTYDPSKADAKYDYCWLWAPDLAQVGSSYRLYFSARRVANGASCPAPGGAVTVFYATSPLNKLSFSAPKQINPGTSYPRTYPSSACPAQGCSRAIRIDPCLYQRGSTQRLYYNWFSGGNNIASFDLSAPGQVTHHTGPASGYKVTAAEGIINEAPDVFDRPGRRYLFFSVDDFRQGYALWYLSASSLGGLTRERQPLAHSRPVRTQGGALLRNHGHSSMTHRRGEYFQFFHVGRFKPAGTYAGRDTYKQRVKFKADGSLHSLSEIHVLWSQIPGYSYSLDVVTRAGKVYGPCVNAGILKQGQYWRYTGVCPSAGNALVPKPEIAKLRVYYSNSSVWKSHVEVPFDGVADDAFVKLPGGSSPYVMLRWNQKQAKAEYSLDVQRPDGSWIAPCAGAYVLGQSLGYTYKGSCPTAGKALAVGKVKRFRICSAVNNDWKNATCGAVLHDGQRMRHEIVIP